jgi:hypothetical protein
MCFQGSGVRYTLQVLSDGTLTFSFMTDQFVTGWPGTNHWHTRSDLHVKQDAYNSYFVVGQHRVVNRDLQTTYTEDWKAHGQSAATCFTCMQVKQPNKSPARARVKHVPQTFKANKR